MSLSIPKYTHHALIKMQICVFYIVALWVMGDQIKEDEIGRTCGPNGREEKYM
jgi:hypothetical protein